MNRLKGCCAFLVISVNEYFSVLFKNEKVEVGFDLENLKKSDQ
jgi:hypothetical protein